jgi:hypothetical protein
MNIATWLGAATLMALTGCAAVAPNYTPSPQTSQPLQSARVQPAKVGEISADKAANNTSITLRASSMEPAQGTYAKYLADAIRQELELTKLYAPDGSTEITGTLLKNDLDTGLADKGIGVMEVRFIVRREGTVRFDKVKAAKTEWETSFVGAIAIPRAQQEYPRLVQTLVSALFSDPDFIAALK